jgi:hypothetical protein
MITFEVTDSSLVKKIEYSEEFEILIVTLTYGVRSYEAEETYFQEFIQAPSKGSFYNKFIKPNFKQVNYQKMADTEKKRPATKNQASDQKRFIKMSIDVTKINKDWLFVGDNGAVYLNCTLQMLPNGELDRFGNLGMITQDVPKAVYEAEKNKPKNEKSQGEILGNGAELDWKPEVHTPGSETGQMGAGEIKDDLPF